jgi:hypothetical protein
VRLQLDPDAAGVGIGLATGLAVVAALSTVPAKGDPGLPVALHDGRRVDVCRPTNATSVTFRAIGGAGASSGGVGDNVQATFSVGAGGAATPGETLYVEVGGNGNGSSGSANGAARAEGGGGASDVRTCSTSSCALSSSDTRLVVAAGGG